ncbi:heterokaryon incompatibility protein-domain-containing protein [Nemania sp. FL0031]|nr:heterokaryon incompatibility protein-domain-containing protein [Nemania sp. FL0031]
MCNMPKCGFSINCERTQQANTYDELPVPEKLLRPEQHKDIFHVKETAKEGCGLCRIIFQAFKRRNVTNEEDARGLRIGFCAFGNSIEVCYDSVEGLIKLCGLDIYMSKAIFDKLFQIFQIEEGSPPVLRITEKNPKSQACLELASHWLRDCSENHDSCNPLTEGYNKPKRLIDVGGGSREPSLVDTGTLPRHIKWLALSYCWGGEPSLKLTRDTICMLRSGVAMDRLDPTIRDAIFITRSLGIPYIWVDSLCIIQDPGVEWQEQAGKMNEAYGGSTVTLVVASSKTVREGFLKDRQRQYIPITLFSGNISKITNSPDAYLSPEWDENEDSAGGPWSSRGWTMQEGLLPNRLLYYTSSQVIWRCCEEEKFERGGRKNLYNQTPRYEDPCWRTEWIWNLDMFLQFKNLKDYYLTNSDSWWLSHSKVFGLWYELIEAYSPRQFKDITDRLMALSSIAKVFGSAIQCDDYIAGLWRPDLVRGLMWRTESASFTPSFYSTRTSNDIFPSWSWASIGYESIKIHLKGVDYFAPLSKIQDVHIDLVDPCQPFGMVKSGSITIAGPVKQLPVLYNKAWRSTDETMSKLERYISQILERESSGAVNLRYSSPLGGHFALLQMLRSWDTLHLLVLEATGGVTNGVYTYWRVGTLTLCNADPKRPASPKLIAVFDKRENSLLRRLGPQQEGWRSKLLRAHLCFVGLFEELKKDRWNIIQTVTLV